MNTRRRLAFLAATASLLALLTACAAENDEAPTAPRDPSLAEYAAVALTSPASMNAGTSPTFEWNAVDGATEYRLSVVTADGPVWGWTGESTSVRYGGYDSSPAHGVGALRLTTAAWWSVAAFDADGALLAVSDHRAVAPDAAAPAPLDGGGGAGQDEAPASLVSACELLGDEEAEAFLEGPLAAPGEGGIEANGVELYCSWHRADDEQLTLDIAIKPGVARDSWDESMEIMLESDPDLPHAFDDLGDDSYLEADWGGTRLALIAGDVYLSVRSGFTGGAEQATIDLARELLARYEERAS
ncbi:hypothetical protein [Microbacterium sp. 179-I 3D3 NHS]|uniref:hypothetical protein n=1 Tax=Microbacterium sp. 179-I 3D3 NHS TaxID=3142382 RepID=UPI0039A1FF57